MLKILITKERRRITRRGRRMGMMGSGLRKRRYKSFKSNEERIEEEEDKETEEDGGITV